MPYVLLSYNVKMQGISLTFTLREILDAAHWDSRNEEFMKI